MVIWCEIQVLEGVMEFFGVSWKGSWNVRENGFRKSVATLYINENVQKVVKRTQNIICAVSFFNVVFNF